MMKRSNKKKLGSYPYFSVVFSITMALLVLGIFGLVVINTTKLTKIIRENVEIQVYLDRNVKENNRIQLMQTLSSQPYIIGAQDGVTYISKDEAAKVLIEESGEDFIDFLGNNPLRDAYILRIAESYQSVEKMDEIKAKILEMDGVFEVEYLSGMVDSINHNLTRWASILAGLALLLLFTVIILINNTIKLALFSQRFLIRSMQLVGATSWFIKRPFLSRAVLYGSIGSLVSILILYGLVNYAINEIPQLAMLQDNTHMIILFAGLFVVGLFVAVYSTWHAMGKYLKMSLDELY